MCGRVLTAAVLMAGLGWGTGNQRAAAQAADYAPIEAAGTPSQVRTLYAAPPVAGEATPTPQPSTVMPRAVSFLPHRTPSKVQSDEAQCTGRMSAETAAAQPPPAPPAAKSPSLPTPSQVRAAEPSPPPVDETPPGKKIEPVAQVVPPDVFSPPPLIPPSLHPSPSEPPLATAGPQVDTLPVGPAVPAPAVPGHAAPAVAAKSTAPNAQAPVLPEVVQVGATETVPGAEPGTAKRAAAAGAQNPTLRLEKIGPATVHLGKPLAYEIVVSNTGAAPVLTVRIRDELPAGARLLLSDPKAEVQGGALLWNVGTLEAGAEWRAKVEVQPGSEGEFLAAATATFSAASALQTRVIQPRLALAMTGPDSVPVGDPAVFQIRVTNIGSGTATGVVLHDKLPPGLKHEQGSAVETELGSLAAGETKTITLRTTAVKGGRQVNEATAIGDDGLKATAQAAVLVTEPALLLRKTGPRQRFVNREAEFDLEVSNAGTGPAANVRVVDTLPPELDFVTAAEGGVYDAAARTVTWDVGRLNAGQRKGLSVKVLAKGPGDPVNRAVAVADRVAEAKAEVPLHVEGIPALALEVVDLDDPVEVGAETVYEIRVVNQGTCACTGVQIIATVPAEMQPRDAKGPTPSRVQGQQVIFEPLAKLAAHADTLYRVRVLAQHPGDVRFKVQLSGDQLQLPVYEEESTHVYNE
jgi:uncharacterized repeat protein (TIGR01451 family)